MQQARANIWRSLPFPFGSEFPWDSTGQEEIYLTAQRFRMYTLSNSTLTCCSCLCTHTCPKLGLSRCSKTFLGLWFIMDVQN